MVQIAQLETLIDGWRRDIAISASEICWLTEKR